MGLLINPGQFASPVLQKMNFRVRDVGDRVHLVIGNVVLELPYEAAFDIAALLRLHAKRAKATAGDRSRKWRAIGILADASRAGD